MCEDEDSDVVELELSLEEVVSAVEVRLVVIIPVLEEVVTDVELVVVNDVLGVGIVVVSELEVEGNEVEGNGVEEAVVSVVNVVCVDVVSFNGLFCLFSNSTMACVASGSCLWGVPNPFRTSSLTPCWVVSAECLSSGEGSAPLKAS